MLGRVEKGRISGGPPWRVRPANILFFGRADTLVRPSIRNKKGFFNTPSGRGPYLETESGLLVCAYMENEPVCPSAP